jgi:hypothetical protein
MITVYRYTQHLKVSYLHVTRREKATLTLLQDSLLRILGEISAQGRMVLFGFPFSADQNTAIGFRYWP